MLGLEWFLDDLFCVYLNLWSSTKWLTITFRGNQRKCLLMNRCCTIFCYMLLIFPHSVFMCFVSISEQTAIISLCSINWLVCITETECVYCAVLTGSLYIIQTSGHYMYCTVVTICTTSLTFNDSTFCPHSVFMYFVWIWEQTAIISLYSINWLVFITETECIYYAVRTGSLYITG
jgi:hypothetical protein